MSDAHRAGAGATTRRPVTYRSSGGFHSRNRASAFVPPSIVRALPSRSKTATRSSAGSSAARRSASSKKVFKAACPYAGRPWAALRRGTGVHRPRCHDASDPPGARDGLSSGSGTTDDRSTHSPVDRDTRQGASRDHHEFGLVEDGLRTALERSVTTSVVQTCFTRCS